LQFKKNIIIIKKKNIIHPGKKEEKKM